jgi:DNA (cytosine-5)-methyltransferase 1
MQAKKPTAIDLFCGCGGLTQGLKDAGFCVLGGVDIDKLSVETYRANHPEVQVLENDIRQLKVSAIKRNLGLRKGSLDLLAGCPPCQGFSRLITLNGKRRFYDPRNGLLLEFLRFIEELMPKAVMLENVPGLAKYSKFKDFCRRLKKLGYHFEHRILDAANYGVPQRRRRLILLAGLSAPIEFAAPSKIKKTVRDAISNLPQAGESDDPLHDIRERRSAKTLQLISRIPKDGGSRTNLPENEQLECHKNFDGFRDIYGRMAWDDISPTITSGCFNPSKGRFLHPMEDRAITLREAALLQTFPKNYFFSLKNGKCPVAVLIGNALPPEFIKRISLEIINSLYQRH